MSLRSVANEMSVNKDAGSSFVRSVARGIPAELQHGQMPARGGVGVVLGLTFVLVREVGHFRDC